MSIRDLFRSSVPAYDRFFTLEEQDESTRRLAQEFPDRLQVQTIGHSTEGRPIQCLTIGDGPKHALMLGCPHPNEPIGIMTIEFLSRFFCENPDFLAKTGYTWHMIKAVDPDGVKRNEGWFKGPYNLYNYARSYYRPAGRMQVEWTFPFDYKTMHWHTPLSETQALMRLIERVKPSVLYSLHNGGFGGVFWYITEANKDMVSALHGAAKDHGIPLSLGEPEMPCMTPLASALFRFPSVGDIYEFYAQMLAGVDPATLLVQGDSSIGYANKDGRTCYGIVAELPYYFHPDVADESLSARSRKASLLAQCDALDEIYGFLEKQLATIRHLLPEGDCYTVALDERRQVGATSIASMRAFAESDPAFEAPATKAQDFDNRFGLPALHMLGVGMLLGAIDQRFPTATGMDAVQLATARDNVDAFLRAKYGAIEQAIDYTVIPVQKLVAVQAESGLAAAFYADGRLDQWV